MSQFPCQHTHLTLSHHHPLSPLPAPTSQPTTSNESPHRIIHTSTHFLVLQKPPHILVDSRNPEQTTIQTQHKKTLKPCHQIDAGTSGIYVFAKTKIAASETGRLFQERETRKTYIAVLNGYAGRERETVEMNGWIQERDTRRCEIVPGPREGQKAGKGDPQFACTKMQILKHVRIYESQMEATLVRLAPVTGRRHQLRVHCAALGHPIVGDWEYEVMPNMESGRMLLHAYQIELPFPDVRLLTGEMTRTKKGKLRHDTEEQRNVIPFTHIWRTEFPFADILDMQELTAYIKDISHVETPTEEER